MMHKYKRTVTFVPPPRLPKDETLATDRLRDERHDSLASRLHSTFAEILPKKPDFENVQDKNTAPGSEAPASKKDTATRAERGSKPQSVSDESEDLDGEYSVVSMVVSIRNFTFPCDKSRLWLTGFDKMPLIDIDIMWPRFMNDSSQTKSGNGEDKDHVSSLSGVDFGLTDEEKADVSRLERLHDSFGTHKARSLDHYFHRELSREQLEDANTSQVLSRYIHHQRSSKKGLLMPSKQGKTRAQRKTGALTQILSILRGRRKDYGFLAGSQGLDRESLDVEKQGIKRDGSTSSEHGNAFSRSESPLPCTAIVDDLEEQDAAALPRQHIVVVPQLWLWKIDSKPSIIFTYLDRRRASFARQGG